MYFFYMYFFICIFLYVFFMRNNIPMQFFITNVIINFHKFLMLILTHVCHAAS